MMTGKRKATEEPAKQARGQGRGGGGRGQGRNKGAPGLGGAQKDLHGKEIQRQRFGVSHMVGPGTRCVVRWRFV